jgi:hypothetical protein
LNEDRWVVQEVGLHPVTVLIAGVIDGAAPLVSDEKLPEGVTAGDLAAEGAKEVLSSVDPRASLKSMLLQVNRHIRHISLHHKVDYARPEALWAVAASLIRLDRSGRLEYAHIADTAIILVTAEGERVLSHDQVGFFDQAPLLRMQEARRQGILDPEEQVEFARPEMVRIKGLANAPAGAGYGALNGMPDDEVEAYIEEGELSLTSSAQFVALVTDGMLPPPTSIGQDQDWPQIASILGNDGLAALLAHTRQIERSDPWLERPRVKMHDDATGVLIRLQ